MYIYNIYCIFGKRCVEIFDTLIIPCLTKYLYQIYLNSDVQSGRAKY